MGVEHIELMVSHFLDEGFSFVEMLLSKVFCYKIGYNDSEKHVEVIQTNYIAVNSIYKEKYSKIFLTYDETFQLNNIINLMKKNAYNSNAYIDYLKADRGSLFYDSSNKYDQILEVCNSNYYNKIYNWVLEEKDIINHSLECDTKTLIYSLEVNEIVYLNSIGNKGRYFLEFTQLDNSIEVSSSLNKQNLIFSSISNVKAFESIYQRLIEDNIGTKVQNKRKSNIIQQQLHGKVRLSYKVCSQLILNLVNVFNADAVASNRAFIKPKDIGERIFGTNISLYDLPITEKDFGNYYFDMEGIPTKKKHLIKDGYITDLLGSIRSSIDSSISTPGNAFRKMPLFHTINIYPTNLCLEVGGIEDNDFNMYICEFSSDCRLDLQTGMLIGQAYGYIIQDSVKSTASFMLNNSIFQILSNSRPATKSEWIGTVFTPEIVFEINK